MKEIYLIIMALLFIRYIIPFIRGMRVIRIEKNPDNKEMYRIGLSNKLNYIWEIIIWVSAFYLLSVIFKV